MSTPDWEARFRATRLSLPDWADDAPHRNLYLSNQTGTFELYAWDRDAGSTRQVTDRPNGTSDGTVDPSGEWIWWYADTDGDEYGVWMRQPFGGGDDVPAVPGLARAYSAGLALGRGGLVVVGQSDDGYGTRIWVSRPDAEPALLYEHKESASVADLSEDGTLVALTHSEHGDSRHPAIRVIRLDPSTIVGELWDGPGKGLGALEFAPLAGDPRLLVQHERRGRPELLIWDVTSGDQAELALDLPGELSASWFTDGSAILLEHAHAARSELYRYDLERATLERIDTPAGLVRDASARPDGTVEFSWSSSEQPPAIRSSQGGEVLTPPGAPAPASVPAEDAWVDGPGGRIHALISKPSGVPPHPTVFLVHGGPTWQDFDAFAPDVAAWVDHGFAVVRVNYRGSTGYGSAWRDALEAAVGMTELADIAAVREWAVSAGLADPGRVVLSGASWGGFLTLLGLGRQPELWTAGIAGVPVADYVAAYEDEMEGLKAFDRSLFGGAPDDVPDKYRESSPITYVDEVVAPVLVLAGENDPRCPIRQIDNYLERLTARGAAHEVYRFDAGHGSLVVAERIRQMRAELDFALARLAAGNEIAEGRTSDAG